MNCNVILNQTVFLLLSFLTETIIFCDCIRGNRRLKHIVCYFGIKMFLSNWLLGIVFVPWHRDSEILQYVNFLVDIVFTVFGFCLCARLLQLSVVKLCYFFCTAELVAMACTFIPVYLMLLVTGKDMLRYQRQNLGKETALHIGLSLCMLFLIRRLLRPFLERLKSREIKHMRAGYLFVGLFLTTGIIMTILGYQGEEEKFIYPGVTTALAVVFLVLGYLYLQYRQTQYLKLQNENLKLQKDLITEHYQALCNQIELTRKFRHDIANHMQTIERLLSQQTERDEQTDAYVSALKMQYDRITEVDYCDNPIIDAAVSNKVKSCKEKGIPIHISLRAMELGEIKEMDMLGLVFNLLDNAIESCLLMPCEKRYIDFCCETCKGQMVITLSNSACDTGEKGQLFRTKKKDGQYHGTGMTIVREIVKKYDGQMKVSFQEPDFKLQIMMNRFESI